MKTPALFSMLALVTLSSTAMAAEPATLTDTQMDTIKAGGATVTHNSYPYFESACGCYKNYTYTEVTNKNGQNYNSHIKNPR